MRLSLLFAESRGRTKGIENPGLLAREEADGNDQFTSSVAEGEGNRRTVCIGLGRTSEALAVRFQSQGKMSDPASHTATEFSCVRRLANYQQAGPGTSKGRVECEVSRFMEFQIQLS